MSSTPPLLDARAAKARTQASHDALSGLLLVKTAVIAATDAGQFACEAPLPRPVTLRGSAGMLQTSLGTVLTEHGEAGIAEAVSVAKRCGYQVRAVTRPVGSGVTLAITGLFLAWSNPGLPPATNLGLIPAQGAHELSQQGAVHMKWLQGVLERVGQAARQGRESVRFTDTTNASDAQWDHRVRALKTLSYEVVITPVAAGRDLQISW